MSKVFLVGGAVRDLLMGLEPKDLDFVVVGSSPEEMLSLGFTQVGADFPVFLHPATGDEFALARTERKVGEGHTGFDCEWEGVTLEEDLSRRDLTINAMALPMAELEGIAEIPTNAQASINIDWFVENDKLVDPFNGQQHLKNKKLEHVSKHFSEDPLRVLRVARFLARFGPEWNIDGSTISLCDSMVSNGELDSLTAERVWKEMSRALMEDSPHLFFETLHFLDWEGIPELTALFKVPQPPAHHPEGDAGIHTLLCLEAAAKMNLTLEERFAVLCHDFGKWPAHVENTARGDTHLGGHEEMGLPLIDALCDRWKVTNDCRILAKLVAKDHSNVHGLAQRNPKTLVKMFERWDILRHPERTLQIFHCCVADQRGRGPTHEDDIHPAADLLPHLHEAWCRKVDVAHIQHQSVDKKLAGKLLGEKVRQTRMARVKATKKELEVECQ